MPTIDSTQEGGVFTQLWRGLVKRFRRPAPMIPIGCSDKPKAIVIFVHGFGSDHTCWNQFLELIAKDALLCQEAQFDCYDYPTQWFNWNPLNRIPSLEELGNGLGGFIERRYADVPKLFLIGHSQGGLVIQSYLAAKIAAQEGNDLAKIRSVVLFATPNRGSEVFSGLRRLASVFLPNPQERTLRVLNPEIARLGRSIEKSILGASSLGPASCPIPFLAFWGLQDNIVPEASARGSFVETKALPGTHFTILRPDVKNASDDRYLALRSAILAPMGHPEIFEVALIDVLLEVFPFPTVPPYIAKYGGKSRKVTTDNRAHRLMQIKFSAGNRCQRLFSRNYRTSGQGFVRCASIDPANEADPIEISAYDADGTTLKYSFTPRKEGCLMDLEIFKGFDAGNRDWHDHLDQRVHCERYRMKLDLKAYIDAGYEIKPEPELRYFPQNLIDRNLEDRRQLEHPKKRLEPSEPGVWVWEVLDFRGGVIDLVWDVVKRG